MPSIRRTDKVVASSGPQEISQLRIAGVWTSSLPGSCPWACDHNILLRGS